MMPYYKILTFAGFAIGGVGFLIAIATKQKMPSAVILIIGFYVAIVGVVLSIFSKEYQKSFGRYGVGLKIGVAGIAVSSLSFLVELMNLTGRLSDIFFYCGLIIAIIGALLVMLKIKGNQ